MKKTGGNLFEILEVNKMLLCLESISLLKGEAPVDIYKNLRFLIPF